MPTSSVLKVTAGRSRFTLQMLPESDFPDITAGTFTHKFKITASQLRGLIEHTQFAISTEETRYYLNGIYLHAVEEAGKLMLRAVATDGHRLARAQIEAPAGCEGMPGVIIPRKTVGEIQKLVEDPEVDHRHRAFGNQDPHDGRRRDPHLEADRRHLPRLQPRHSDRQ